jgi:lysophospholipase L1-like esterase
MDVIKLLCIGDSLTFGYETERSKRWTHLLEKELNIEVINAGINGDTTTGILSRFMPLLRDFKPSHVLIFGGTNDLWFGLKNEFIISNIYAMCKQALHFKVFPIVGIPTPCYNYEELNVIGENYAERINQFQDNLIELCSKKEIIFVNFNSEINQDYFMEDGIHYNERGHIFIMKQLKERLQNLLKSF